MKPLIVVNLKTYKSGEKVLNLCKIIEKVDSEIIVGVSPIDIYPVSHKTKLKVYSQHVDGLLPGRNTGWILPEAVKGVGAVGVFLNHSEHRLKLKEIEKTMEICRKLKLKTMVFAKNLRQAIKIEKFSPDYIIIEPAELIAGKVSVSEARPELIKKVGLKLKSKFLVGAGIHSKQDIEKAVEFGASGVAFSSVITTVNNPEKVLREMLK
jgi:triosephosphate isomerase